MLLIVYNLLYANFVYLQPLTEYELSLLKSKSIEEARIIHRELQRRRLLLSYQEAKFRRQRKIKSKKYHRLEKKKKLKNSVEDFEKLVEENSDKAAETLEELDRLRALERASLKHRNTGKWAKHNKLRAKYDDQAREALEQQMKINAELMKKRKLLSLPGSQLEIDDNVDSPVALEKNMENDDEPLDIIDDYNPWVSSNKPSKKKKTTHLVSCSQQFHLLLLTYFSLSRPATRINKMKRSKSFSPSESKSAWKPRRNKKWNKFLLAMPTMFGS